MFPPHITRSRYNKKDFSLVVAHQLRDKRLVKGPSYLFAWTDWTPSDCVFTMRDQHTTICKIMILERKCTDRAVRLRSALESQLLTGSSSSDVWDKTVSFFSVKKALIFHNGFTKSSRDAMRLFPSPAEDVAPLC
uniref:uncharacterized protein n=1 Tax=Semicossyphus pulcher TaxID=241346 RepID=UPI0037E80590